MTRRKLWRKPSGLPPTRDWLDARSRTRLAPKIIHFTILVGCRTDCGRCRGGSCTPVSFILTARAHNFAYATPRLDETISRFRPSKKREPMCFSLAPT